MRGRLALALVLVCALTACQPGDPGAFEKTPATQEEKMEERNLLLTVNGTPVTVTWEGNRAVEELKALAQGGAIVVQARAYGGFEQVGALPTNLTANDEPMTTVPGDIVLFSGDQIVLFHGSNTWSYTRLGHIEGLTDNELAALLDHESVILELACTQP